MGHPKVRGMQGGGLPQPRQAVPQVQELVLQVALSLRGETLLRLLEGFRRLVLCELHGRMTAEERLSRCTMSMSLASVRPASAACSAHVRRGRVPETVPRDSISPTGRNSLDGVIG